MKFFRFFLTIAVIFLCSAVKGQILYQVGALSILESDGQFYRINGDDTTKVFPDKILLKFKDGVTPEAKTGFANNNGLTFIKSTLNGVSLYTLNQGSNFIGVTQSLSASTLLEFFDLNYLYKTLSNFMPPNNDIDWFSWNPWWAQENIMWPYTETDVYGAWNITKGTPDIIVANLDNGISLNHSDLGNGSDGYSNIWVNHKEIPDNGIDDDNNGYIDDYYGWNFGTFDINWGDNNVTHYMPDLYSHGSMTGSIIAAKTNNGNTNGILGAFGIAGGWGNRGVSLMNVKISSPNENIQSANIPYAIEYACLNGAKVVNMAFGGGYSQAIDDEIGYHYGQGVVFVAAVGNNSSPGYILFPSSSENVIAVGATEFVSWEARWHEKNSSLTWGSNYIDDNYGVEIMAPCSPISISAQGQNSFYWDTEDYDIFSTKSSASTSASSSFVSGVVALMLSVNPCLSPDEVRQILRETADKLPGMMGHDTYDYNSIPGYPGCNDQMGYGRINAARALENVAPGAPILITGAVAPWTTDRNIYYNITIEQNGVLEINNCEVSFAPDVKIIVQQGGRLIVNNSVLTGLCDATWQGIEVWGNSSANQWPDENGKYSQGYVVLDSATIQNAVNALNLWKPGDHTQTGGIVHATGTTFNDNVKSVHALLYRNSHPINEREMDYNSSFSDCNFEITADYNGTHTFYKHVDLNQVNGIKFKGCDFSLSSAAINIAKFNQAIAAYSSGFKVEAICINPGIGTCDYDRSTFSGFYSAIYSGNGSNLSYTFSVNRADFTNNSIGIEVNSVKNHSILFCNFKLGPNTGDAGTCSTSGAPSFGIDMVESNSYIIEENNFIKNEGAPQGLYVGIRCKDSKTLLDVIYRNSFSGLSYGNYAEGLNRSDPDVDDNGLQFMCNTNQNNAIDFIVAKKNVDDRPMIHSFQGSRNLEAKNTFSANPLQYGHFRNDGRQIINYFYNTSPPQYYTPVYVVPVYVTAVNQCPSNFGGINPKSIVLDESQKLQRELDYATNIADYNNVKFLLDNLKDGGDTEGLKLEVSSSWPQDMWELRAKLLGDSPHLSEEVLKLAADKTDVLPESVLFEILSANPDELRKETLIEYLENKEQPLPEYMISILKQLAGGITYKTVLKQDMAKYEAEKVKAANDLIRSCLNDSYMDYNYLRSWYDNLNNLNADYEIVASYLTEKNYSAVSAMLDVIPAVRNLTGNELDEFNEYKGFILWQIQMIQQGENIFSIDDSSFEMLLETAENGASRASMMGRALLEYGHGYHFEKCLPGAEGASLKTSYVDNAINENGISIKANPNPASSWVAFEYELPFNVSKGEILVTDMHGRTIVSFKVTGNVGQQVWDTRQVEKGIYIYTLKAGTLNKQGKLVVQ
jgi:hypothetical protein